MADIGRLGGSNRREDATHLSGALRLVGLAGEETSGCIVLYGAADVASLRTFGVALFVAKALALGKDADQSVVARELVGAFFVKPCTRILLGFGHTSTGISYICIAKFAAPTIAIALALGAASRFVGDAVAHAKATFEASCVGSARFTDALCRADRALRWGAFDIDHTSIFLPNAGAGGSAWASFGISVACRKADRRFVACFDAMVCVDAR